MKNLFLILAFTFGIFYANAQSDMIIGDGSQQMPDFRFYTLGGVEVNRNDLKFTNKCIIIAYSPTCSHCVEAAKTIGDNWEEFKNIKIYWVTQAPKSKIKEFKDMYFTDKPNCVFWHDTERMMFEKFVFPELPRFFIYNKNKEMVANMSGKYPLDMIQFLGQ
jgi:hypothetical protein